MFHFWFNTFFVEDEESIDLQSAINANSAECSANDKFSMISNTTPPSQHGLVPPIHKVVQQQNSNPYNPQQMQLKQKLQSELLSKVPQPKTTKPSTSIPITGPLKLQTQSSVTPKQNLAEMGSSVNKTSKVSTWPPSMSGGLHHNPGTMCQWQPPGNGGVRALNSVVSYKTLTFGKSELDKANKDQLNKLYPADFKVSEDTSLQHWFLRLASWIKL